MTGHLNDLFVLNLTRLAWRKISSLTADKHPSPRQNFGFASLEGKLYVHGGCANFWAAPALNTALAGNSCVDPRNLAENVGHGFDPIFCILVGGSIADCVV